MREPRLYDRTWRRAGPLRRQRFFDILSEQREGGPFDSAFIDLLHKRRSSTIRFWFKLISLQFPILALLVLALIPIHASVSVLGITPAASRNLREILVVISAIFGVIASGVSIYYAVLNEMIEAYVIKLSKGNSETKEFLGIAHGVDFLIFPKSLDKNVHIGWGFGVFLLAVFAALAVLVLSIVAGFLYLHLYVLSDIYNDPSFSRKISVYV